MSPPSHKVRDETSNSCNCDILLFIYYYSSVLTRLSTVIKYHTATYITL